MSKANVGTYDPELDTVISFEEVCITIKVKTTMNPPPLLIEFLRKYIRPLQVVYRFWSATRTISKENTVFGHYINCACTNSSHAHFCTRHVAAVAES